MVVLRAPTFNERKSLRAAQSGWFPQVSIQPSRPHRRQPLLAPRGGPATKDRSCPASTDRKGAPRGNH